MEEIAEECFASSDLVRIEIPRSVRAVGARAFRGCKRLEAVSFEEGSALRNVGAEAFAGTPLKPEEVAFPISVDLGEVFGRKSEGG